MEETNQYFVKVNDMYVSEFSKDRDRNVIEEICLHEDIFDRKLLEIEQAKEIAKLINGEVFKITYVKVPL